MRDAREVTAACALVAVLAGCTPYAVAEVEYPPVDAMGEVPEDRALVCWFRPGRLGSAVTIAVRDNGALVGATQGPSYFCYEAMPGDHVIEVEGSDADPIVFEAVAGRARFFLHRIALGQDDVVPIERSKAARLVSSSEYLVVDSTGGDEPLPGDVPLARAR